MSEQQITKQEACRRDGVALAGRLLADLPDDTLQAMTKAMLRHYAWRIEESNGSRRTRLALIGAVRAIDRI